jgi:hypothetical protein
LSGSTNTVLYPFIAETIAKPTPVFPDVASTMVPPGFSLPDRSASAIILTAMRSLTEPPGLKNSTFAYNEQAKREPMRFSLINGVLPIASKILSWTRKDSDTNDEVVVILCS